MGSKGKGGACNLPSTSEEDEGSNRKKRPVQKTFRIYSTEYVTSSNRDEKKMASAKIGFNVNTTERKIRELLIRKLPQLRGKRFKFFTKDSAGKWYFCPCSLKCEGKDHSAEWNGRNIPRAAKSNRTVYVLIESTTVEETGSRRVQNDTLTNSVPSDSQLRGSVGQYSRNPLSQKEGRVPKNYQSVSCPDLSLSGLEHQENTSAPPLSAYHGNDLNQWPTQLTQPSQEQTVSETDYEKVKDGGGVTEEKDGEGEGRIDISDEEMQTDVCNNDVASTSDNVSPQMYLESGYDTFPSENNTCLPVNPANSVEEEELRNFFVNGSPLLNTNFNRNASLSTPTEFMENCQEYRRPQITIEEIVPKKGDVAGGETFYLSFADACAVHDFQVQFGPSTIPVVRCSDKVFNGKVPSSSTDGVVEVYLVDYLRRTISNSVNFEYTDQRKAKDLEDSVDKNIKTLEDLQKGFLLLCTKMGKMTDLTSNDTNNAKETNLPGDVKTQALSLLYVIASTAAMLNAMDFFRIIFSTQVGHNVFKSCKDAQTPLEEIARENGHEELARLLEEKHSKYQDAENESDDEVDWKELARAIEKYQTLKGETAEKKSIPSTSSSEQIQGYLGDGESSTSLSSLHLLDVEGCIESTFEDQETTQESMCGEEPNTCQSTAAEGCPESTFEEQQTTTESTCEEEPDTCQTIAAKGFPEITIEERYEKYLLDIKGRIVRGLIQDGMSDTDIINTISSSDELRMNKAYQIKETQSLIGEKNLLANLYLNPLHLACSSPIIMKSYQMDTFAPKEVSSLRRKLGPFDAAKMNPSALYPNRDQTICNLMRKEPKQDLTGGLKAQKSIKHQETAENELCDAKSKGATVMKTESIISLYSPLHSKVESGLEIATLAGSASNISLQEQSSEEEISQSARSFEEHLFGKWFFETSKNEIKSVWSSLVRTRRLTRVAVFLTSFLVVVVCLATFFTLWVSTKTQTPTTVPTIAPTTAVETMTTSRQACSSGLLTLSCEGVTNLNEVHELRWKIKFPDAGWNEFAYCGKSGMNCVVTKSELPEGIKVLEVSNRSVNLQRITKNNANGYAQTMSQVLFSNSSLTAHVYKINFTEKCVWIQERRDLNLTKILQSIAPCERVVHVEWYNINSSKFASCNSCQDCKKTSEDKRVQVFWNRLRVTRGSLLLTAIQEGDNDLSIRVKIEVKASGKSTGRDVGSVHMYTIKIFVNTSSPPDVVSQTLSVCGAESIAIMGPVNGSVQCQTCLKCPAGEGLSVNCGDKISSSTPIVCEPCVLGETYSSAYEAGACKDCENCGPYRETTKACTLTSKAECGKCKVGAYVEPMLNMCTPCSQCCNDGKDIVISQCQVPGVPSTNQCSFARSGVCSKVVTTASVSAVSPAIEIEINHSTVQSTIPSTVTNPVVTSIPSEPIFALPVDAPPSQINVIVGSLFGGVFVVFILPLAIVIRCVMVTRRKNRGDKRQDKTGTQETKPPRRHANTGFKLSGTVPERPEPAFEFYGNTKEPERDTTVRVIVDVNCRAFPVRV